MTQYRILSVDVVQGTDRRVTSVKIGLKELERHFSAITVELLKDDFDRMMEGEEGAAELLKLLDERCCHQDDAVEYEAKAVNALVNKIIVTDDKVG